MEKKNNYEQFWINRSNCHIGMQTNSFGSHCFFISKLLALCQPHRRCELKYRATVTTEYTNTKVPTKCKFYHPYQCRHLIEINTCEWRMKGSGVETREKKAMSIVIVSVCVHTAWWLYNVFVISATRSSQSCRVPHMPPHPRRHTSQGHRNQITQRCRNTETATVIFTIFFCSLLLLEPQIPSRVLRSPYHPTCASEHICQSLPPHTH